MKQCKPCITIRDILVILKNNTVDFYMNTKRDIKAYSTINATVCEMDKPYDPLKVVPDVVKDIRDKARQNYKGEDAAI